MERKSSRYLPALLCGVDKTFFQLIVVFSVLLKVGHLEQEFSLRCSGGSLYGSMSR